MRYVSEEDLEKFCDNIKQFECPFCHVIGRLILHGYLRGYSETSSLKIIRGRRVFCNNRKRSCGCGRTFSLLLLNFIRNFVISTTTVSKVLLNFLDGKSKALIARELLSGFSERYVYGFFSRLKLRQFFIREKLEKRSYPEENNFTNPLLQMISHLTEFFPQNNIIKAFQHFFQVSFL